MSESLNGKPSTTDSAGGAGGLYENFMGMATEALGKIFVKIDNQNLTNGTNETEKFKPTTEGLSLAYSSLVIMALIPIIVGSFKSVKHQKKQQVGEIREKYPTSFKLNKKKNQYHKKESGEEIETMSTKEALLFPVIASVTLFTIYVIFQVRKII